MKYHNSVSKQKTYFLLNPEDFQLKEVIKCKLAHFSRTYLVGFYFNALLIGLITYFTKLWMSKYIFTVSKIETMISRYEF